jgi:23S rRNA (pseudouridine1915-N3)-methyltransferase
MKIILLAVGKTTDRGLADLIAKYVKRIGFYAPFELRELPDIKTTRAMTADKQKELEGEKILGMVRPGDRLVLLDERGKLMTSREFAEDIDRNMVNLQRDLIFVIGGPYGFSQDVYARANAMLSLSRMTFSHEMVRLFFVEQIYRAFTILRGEPYHHD